MVKLQNPSNAFVRLEFSDCIMLCDPWVTRGIFDGGWSTYPPVSSPEKITKDVTHLFISHIHEDHWDLNVIKTLSRNIRILIPDIYPNNLIEKKLKEEGFDDIVMAPLECPIKVTGKITLEAIPPMNNYLSEFTLYSSNEQRPIFAIDAGCIVDDGEIKIVLLSDNTPYDPKSAGKSFERMKNADLLAFNYNGNAADFPLCYDFTEKEIISIANEKESRREKVISSFLKSVSPKLALPYSSDFAVLGPMAEKFCCFENEWWFNKKTVATHYEQKHNIASTYLLEGDVICLDKTGHVFESKRKDFPSVREFLHENYHNNPLTKELYPTSSPYEIIKEKTEKSAKNMFSAMEKHGLQSEWVLAIQLDNFDFPPIFIDLGKRYVCETIDPKQKTLTCILDSGYFEALLDRKCHWNNAHSSFQLKWKRIPNEYDIYLYGALNFFHLSEKSSTFDSMPRKG